MRILPLAIAAALLAPLAASCSSIKDSDRHVNWQNVGAGVFVEERADAIAANADAIAAATEDPAIDARAVEIKTDAGAVKQAGTDVKENASNLASTSIGAPEEKKPYSPVQSDQDRKDNVKAHEEPPFLFKVAQWVASATGLQWLSTAIGFAGTAFFWFKKARMEKGLKAVTSGIETIRAKVKEKGTAAALDPEAIDAALRAGQEVYGVWKWLKPLIRDWRKNGTIRELPPT